MQMRLRRLEQRIRPGPIRTDACPLDFAAWARHYLASYFPIPDSSFHRWLVGELETLHTRRGTRIAVIAPRRSAKSTWSSFAYPLWCAVEGHEPYIQIVSDSIGQAHLWLEAIQHELEENALLAADYPHVCGPGPVWRQDRMRLRNGVVIEALGTGSKIRGRRNRQDRPSLIIVDDPENEDHVTSAVMRERSWQWFTRAVLNAGTMQTNIIVLGTTLHRECLVLRLQKAAGWQARLFRAIVQWPLRMDWWAAWEEAYNDWENSNREKDALAYYRQYREELHEGAEVLWPEAESLYDLMCLRATIGSAAFAAEKQGDPVDPSVCEWPSSYFDYLGFWFERWPEHLTIKTLALDPSKGQDAKKGDYSAYVKLGRDINGILYCEADLQRRDSEQIVADGVEHVRQFRPEGFAIETNQFQQLFVPDFQRVGREQNVDLPIYTIDNQVKKEVRIRRIGPYLAQRLMRFKAHSPGTLLLVQQLRDFPVGDHDDGPDALECAIRLSVDLWNNRHQEWTAGWRA
jgi:predicted phage terminase large subunit-like protein